MRKKFFSIILCTIMTFSMALPTSAAEVSTRGAYAPSSSTVHNLSSDYRGEGHFFSSVYSETMFTTSTGTIKVDLSSAVYAPGLNQARSSGYTVSLFRDEWIDVEVERLTYSVPNSTTATFSGLDNAKKYYLKFVDTTYPETTGVTVIFTVKQ